MVFAREIERSIKERKKQKQKKSYIIIYKRERQFRRLSWKKRREERVNLKL